MTSSSQVQDGEIQDSSGNKTQEKQSLCDFCGDSLAVLYCKADSAKLCLTCDRKVHSTNQLFTKHTRSVLCDACHSSPSSIFCSTHCSVLCLNCDWESHRISQSSVHDRRPLEGFNGCPSVAELLAYFGFDDLGKRMSSRSDGTEEFLNFGFSDYLVWETPSVVSLDDLISSDGSDHNFQVMGFPPLPKNRNTVCGQRKEEILCQLRGMAKLEPGIDQNKLDLEPSSRFQSLFPYHDCQQQNLNSESKTEPTFFPCYEGSTFQWCNDIGKDAEESLPNTSFQSYLNIDCLVPDKEPVIDPKLHQGDKKNEIPSQNPVVTEASEIFPKVPHEFCSQHRDSAITRYKEKRKSRRYEKHIRYESRKVRAESRVRVKGRFAKIDR
ncbi:B-box type zinc finger protein with CCT domain [Heracleum sosnowskyi]|uniref:B-box type zinc finger protein with CCT domain n=1 Tax=Heracleum sosnowskyi TaxID=360622 RepID=A0AAD8N8X3_9APIA|nr:B-box type zinc finger protein with CCT domain [Heracleum sosnowskyi]